VELFVKIGKTTTLVSTLDFTPKDACGYEIFTTPNGTLSIRQRPVLWYPQ
jgi:hypothetical protein